MRITLLSASGNICSFVEVIISFVIIHTIFDLFILLKFCKAKPVCPWLLPKGNSCRSQKLIGLNFLEEKRRKRKEERKSISLILKSLLLYCIVFFDIFMGV